MDVWEVPVSSCPGLDRGPLMDVGPEQVAHLRFVTSGDQTEARGAEDQKLRNRSLAIRPLIVCPDGAR